MRTPTDLDAALNWWRRTIAGERVPHIEDEPQPGFFYMRNVKGGPKIPVRVEIVQEIDPETGELAAPEEIVAHVFGYERPMRAVSIWLSLRAIPEAEYHAILAMHHDKNNAAAMQATKVQTDIMEMRFLPPRRTM